MGQKTEFNLEDWDFPEEKSLASERSDLSLPINITDESNVLDQEIESLIEEFDEAVIEAQDSKLYISGKLNKKTENLSQEELAFKRQIEDLFELLELEKKADKRKGVRVYQTDSSPSRPWRFH